VVLPYTNRLAVSASDRSISFYGMGLLTLSLTTELIF